MLLDSRDDQGHGGAVQPELHSVIPQALLDQSLQNTVTHDGLHGVLQHGHSGGGKGVAGGEETLHSPSMSMLCAPAVW